jgi:hypothetical protein
MSLKDKFLAVENALLDVEIPVWGNVKIKQLTLADMEKLRNASDVEAVLLSVVCGVVDAEGKAVFGADDWDRIKLLPWEIVQAVATAVHLHSKLTTESVAIEKKD